MIAVRHQSRSQSPGPVPPTRFDPTHPNPPVAVAPRTPSLIPSITCPVQRPAARLVWAYPHIRGPLSRRLHGTRPHPNSPPGSPVPPAPAQHKDFRTNPIPAADPARPESRSRLFSIGYRQASPRAVQPAPPPVPAHPNPIGPRSPVHDHAPFRRRRNAAARRRPAVRQHRRRV